MASFTNFATLSYNGGTTNSNIVTGEILEALTAVKTAVSANYSAGDRITYALSLVNTGTAAITDYTVTDNLGGYTVGANTVYPLAYNAGTVRYYINGVLQTAPTVTAGPPLTVTGLTVPAGGSAVLIYETTATPVAPLATGSSITNTATITGGGLTTPITAQATVETANSADLTISKALSPTTVTENGQITYTFVISNTGNTEATALVTQVVSNMARSFKAAGGDVVKTLGDGILATFDTELTEVEPPELVDACRQLVQRWEAVSDRGGEVPR